MSNVALTQNLVAHRHPSPILCEPFFLAASPMREVSCPS